MNDLPSLREVIESIGLPGELELGDFRLPEGGMNEIVLSCIYWLANTPHLSPGSPGDQLMDVLEKYYVPSSKEKKQ